MYERSINSKIFDRLSGQRQFVQVIIGPRQIGKTTAIQAVLKKTLSPHRYISCDDPGLHDRIWLSQQWGIARSLCSSSTDAVLVIDEIQKVPQWSETVKRLWDEDTASGLNLKVVLLGSSSLLVQKGLSDSLAGRFEVIHATHWLYGEMRDAFGWNQEQYIMFGGYPGAAPLVADYPRWRGYVMESLIEPSISNDILQMERISKPALMRQLFHLGCLYSSQILSYQKLVGQLQDSGNTTTLAHYLTLLDRAGLLRGINKYTASPVQTRNSSPKLQVLNNALLTAQLDSSPAEIWADPAQRGRIVESSVGAHLCALTAGTATGIFYWRERNLEVDFIIRSGDRCVALEVKSGRRRDSLPGMAAFTKQHPTSRMLLIGEDGIGFEKFFGMSLGELFGGWG